MVKASITPITADASIAPHQVTFMAGTKNWAKYITTAAVTKPTIPRFCGEILFPRRLSAIKPRIAITIAAIRAPVKPATLKPGSKANQH